MSNRDHDATYLTLSQALAFCFQQEIKDVHTVIPGIVRQYEPTTKRARVHIAINLLLTSGETRPRPEVANVPVCHPSGGGYVVHIPLKPGDPVLLLFSERGIENFKAVFSAADPPPDALFSERDAIAVPGFGSLSITPATNGLTVQTEDGENFVSIEPDLIKVETPGRVSVDAGGNVDVDSGGNVTVDASGNVRAEAGGNINLDATGTVTISGTVITLRSGGDALVIR